MFSKFLHGFFGKPVAVWPRLCKLLRKDMDLLVMPQNHLLFKLWLNYLQKASKEAPFYSHWSCQSLQFRASLGNSALSPQLTFSSEGDYLIAVWFRVTWWWLSLPLLMYLKIPHFLYLFFVLHYVVLRKRNLMSVNILIYCRCLEKVSWKHTSLCLRELSLYWPNNVWSLLFQQSLFRSVTRV